MKKILAVLTISAIIAGCSNSPSSAQAATTIQATVKETTVANTENSNDAKSVAKKLSEIQNWFIGDVWNNFVNFDFYRSTGKDCTGSDIDIEFAYEQFKKTYTLKDEYNSYINALPDDTYADIKNYWSKMNEQIDSIYKDLEENGLEQGTEKLSLSLLQQYSDAFRDGVKELKDSLKEK